MSRLLGDPTYESYARRAALALWELRDNSTGLTGNVVDIHTGEWVSKVTTVHMTGERLFGTAL